VKTNCLEYIKICKEKRGYLEWTELANYDDKIMIIGLYPFHTNRIEKGTKK
jgi:hypothetical protein